MSKARNMSDVEVGLIRAMLAKGMRNDEVHFYFNRSDRLISSGRIAQIKNDTYAKYVAAATDAEVDAFLLEWEAKHAAVYAGGPQSPTDIEYINALFVQEKGQWLVKAGETDVVECKLNYAVNANIIRAIAGLANNKGGHILFGIRDKTNVVEGMSDDKFRTLDPSLLSGNLVGALDPVPNVSRVAAIVGGVPIGVLYVEKHEQPPVIAVKNIGTELKEGGIYFRYVGETRLIKPGELRQIISAREQKAVADFTRKMSRVASGAEATIDLDTGQVAGKAGGFVIDKDLLPAIQFIREGDFSEVKGAPALRVVGEVQPISAEDQTRVRIIRENITPTSIIENFLKGNAVQEPLQYLYAQAHYARRWMPIWHYVTQLRMTLDDIVEGLRSTLASSPTSRDAVVQRLRGTLPARKFYTGKPKAMLKAFKPGKISAPKLDADFGAFASAVQGLPDDFAKIEELKPILLDCLQRDKDERHRTAIYRAASRVDEILYNQSK